VRSSVVGRWSSAIGCGHQVEQGFSPAMKVSDKKRALAAEVLLTLPQRLKPIPNARMVAGLKACATVLAAGRRHRI